MSPRLGVLITYYNEGPLLTECLDTLLSGPDKPDEILIHDDASQDPARDHIKDNHPVRIIRSEKNIGIGRARNELMAQSRSEYVHFQDADDYFDPEWCRCVREQIASGEADIVFNNIKIINRVDNIDKTVWGGLYSYPFNHLKPDGDLIHFFLGVGYFILVSMVTFRRSFGLKIGGYLPRESLDVSEDLEFHIRLFSIGLKHRTIDKPLIIKVDRPGSLSLDDAQKLRPEIRISHIKLSRLLLSWLPKNYYPSLAIHLLKSSLHHFNNHEIDESSKCFELAGSLEIHGRNTEVADFYHRNGAEFLRIADFRRAKEAFQFARCFGPAHYKNYSGPYRVFARTIGPELTERWALFYRQKVPKIWRRGVRKIFP